MSAELKQTVLDIAAALPVPELHMARAEIMAAAAAIGGTGSRQLGETYQQLAAANASIDTTQGHLATAATHLYEYASIFDTPVETGEPDWMTDEMREHEANDYYGGILTTGTVDTFRGIRQIEYDIRKDFGIDLRTLIAGKVVADMGSGQGGFAKSIAAEGIPATVYSVNPRLSDPRRKRKEVEAGILGLRQRYPNVTDADIARIQTLHDEHLLTAFAHELPVPNAFFDVMLDHVAVHTYLPDIPELYEKTIREYARVLKPGGIVIVCDVRLQESAQVEIIAMRKRAAAEFGLTYRVVNYGATSTTLGALIWKGSR